ncbi:MAG: amidohydrolase family protein [Mariniblastus sp.]|nr:amidohydrolase family protein [Mariniblastus sp.]
MPIIEIPLLADHHSHPLLYAALQQAADLTEVGDLDSACDQIRQAADPQGSLTLAFGWKDHQFKFPAARLEQLPPLALFNVSLHQLLLNGAGERLLSERYGNDVSRIHDRDWYESHLPTILSWFANLAGSADRLVLFYQQLEQLGVWSAEEMLLAGEQEIEWFHAAGLLERTKFWSAPEMFAELSPAAQDQVEGIKLFTDGALGARSAALQQPYQSVPSSKEDRGMLIYTDPQLQRALAGAASTGKSIAIHAIGDRAIAQVIHSLEALGPSVRQFPQVRLEHGQFIDLQQAQRAKQLGIVLSMQPNFNADSVHYQDRLPNGYAQRNNPFRMLIDQAGFQPGIDLILGSDGMPHGATFALEQSLYPPYENQRLTLEEFQAAYGSDTDRLFRAEIQPPGEENLG